MIEFVSATRMSRKAFWEKSALGVSLRRLNEDTRLSAFITFENRLGLPDIYNARIASEKSPDILVFIHDDVWIDDYYIADRIIEGLQIYDVVGVAGNTRRVPDQPAWIFPDNTLEPDKPEYLSGGIAHSNHPFGAVTVFGITPRECELLDGVFLATRKTTLISHQIAFDPQFDFHFYDMDFCRSFRSKELQLGTWPICLTHQSGGAFGSPAWREKLERYNKKWQGA